MIRFPEPRVSFDRITDLVYLGSRIASLDDYLGALQKKNKKEKPHAITKRR